MIPMASASMSYDSFQKKCRHVFEQADYRPHTIFHQDRFPLIGKWNAWQYLADWVTINLRGDVPEEDNNETNEHVLDVILFEGQDLFSLKLVKTDMYTIMFIDSQSSLVEDVNDWRIRLNEINGSILLIDCETSITEEALDNLNTNQTNTSDTSPPPSILQPVNEKIRLIKDQDTVPKAIDGLSVIFQDIHNVLSEYQEQKVQELMKECGALVYNEGLKRNDPPDGYYLCDAKCLTHLKKIFCHKPHTFATADLIYTEPPPDRYVLLAVEVKLTIDALQCKLVVPKYYIMYPTPSPIRHLVIFNGGHITQTWLFLINLAHIDVTNRNSRIDPRIYARSHEFAQRFRFGRTHAVYMPSFSSETFRQERLTKSRLNVLCELVKLEGKIVEHSGAILGISGSKKQLIEEERKKKIDSYKTKMINLLDQYMKQYPAQQQRSSVNFWILQQSKTHTVDQLCYLEELALSLLNKTQENVAKLSEKIKLPKQLTDRIQQLRTVKPVSVLIISERSINPPLARQASLIDSSDSDDDDSHVIQRIND